MLHALFYYLLRAFSSRMLKMLKSQFLYQHTKIHTTSKLANAKNINTHTGRGEKVLKKLTLVYIQNDLTLK